MSVAASPTTKRYSSAPDGIDMSSTTGISVAASREFRLPIARDTSSLQVRHAVSEVLQAWSEQQVTGDVLLVVTELVQNLLGHTSSAGDLRMTLYTDVVVVEVADADSRVPVIHERDASREGGRGLIIVAGLSRRWGYRPMTWIDRHGKVIWAELELHPSSPEAAATPPTVSAAFSASTLAALTHQVIDDVDLVDFLHTVVAHTAALIDGASVGLLLTDHRDRLQVMTASDHSTTMLELFQIQHGQGPCLEAFHSRQTVIETDLANAAERWPLFAARAVAAGYQMVYAFPLHIDNRVVGALNVFGSSTSARLDQAGIQVMQTLADLTVCALLQPRRDHQARLTEQLHDALTSRIIIEQATGVLAQTYDLTITQAFAKLRADAYRDKHRLVDAATAAIEAAIPSPSPDNR